MQSDAIPFLPPVRSIKCNSVTKTLVPEMIILIFIIFHFVNLTEKKKKKKSDYQKLQLDVQAQ